MFAAWCAQQRIKELRGVQPVSVAVWVETLQLRLAAIRMLFDWLVVGTTTSTSTCTPTSRERSSKRGKGWLLCSARGRSTQLSDRPMSRADVYRMIGRRAEAAGVRTRIGCHTFRATGITEYLRNGGRLEVAQQMANHESARTTGLYDRRNDQVSSGEVERIVI